MNEKNKSFEQNMLRLEEIVRTMERGDIALDDSLKLFAEGTELIRICSDLLDKAEMQVKKVLPDANGNPHEELFSDEP